MRKVALVFVVAIFAPSLVLAWLAVHSLRDQQFVMERQQSLLCQGIADSLVDKIGVLLAEQQREFRAQVAGLLAGKQAVAGAKDFDAQLRARWPLAEVGFAVTRSGTILSPSPTDGPTARSFSLDNADFLGNVQAAEVYASIDTSNERSNGSRSQFVGLNSTQASAGGFNDTPNLTQNSFNNDAGQQPRSITPQNSVALTQQSVSRLVPSETEFQQLTRDASDGMLARFLRNKLRLMFWHRPEGETNLILGAQIHLPRLTTVLSNALQVDEQWRNEICVALLDDSAKPVARTHPTFTADWKRPFVASEVGEALPHWELAIYPLNPGSLTRSAETARLTLGLLVGTLVAAIAIGSWLIVVDVNRQIRWTRQKADFVSNVSHELKTPLTSIRMFSELLATGKVHDAQKQRSYLQIIMAESSRLTRLINNVLDFARLERGEKKYEFRPIDLNEMLHETVEAYRPHLESAGFKLEFDSAPVPLEIRGDRDALSQVVVNLLSNAEKYSGPRKEVTVSTISGIAMAGTVEIQVSDRGLGVPSGCEEKIFEQFYRAYDSLSSGIQGSGLGLTLARQIARAHGGDVVYRPREGGGSCFALRIPVRKE